MNKKLKMYTNSISHSNKGLLPLVHPYSIPKSSKEPKKGKQTLTLQSQTGDQWIDDYM